MSGLIYWTKSKHTRSLTPCRRKLVVTHVILKYITWHLCLLLWNRELSYTRSVLVGGIFENQITLYSMHITVFTPICLSDFLRSPWSQNANEQYCPLTMHGHFLIEKNLQRANSFFTMHIIFTRSIVKSFVITLDIPQTNNDQFPWK